MSTMISDITLDFVKNYLRIPLHLTLDDAEIELLMVSAKDLLVNETHRTIEELDARPSANTLYLKMIADFYHNRASTSDLKLDPMFQLMIKSLRKKGIL